MNVRLELTLDEVDLIGAALCRDRDRLLDAAHGCRAGTRLLTDQEQALVPTHQEILRKIEQALNTSAGRPLNEAIGADQTSPVDDVLGKVRSLCNEFSLRAAHRDRRAPIELSPAELPGPRGHGGDGRGPRHRQGANAVTRKPLHQARLTPWSTAELMAQLCVIVDTLAADKDRAVSPLDVALELLGGELEAFVLFGRMGHLDPPREDGKVVIGILRRMSKDPEIDGAIRDTAKKWAADQESRS